MRYFMRETDGSQKGVDGDGESEAMKVRLNGGERVSLVNRLERPCLRDENGLVSPN